jgi:hypothetical protein
VRVFKMVLPLYGTFEFCSCGENESLLIGILGWRICKVEIIFLSMGNIKTTKNHLLQQTQQKIIKVENE